MCLLEVVAEVIEADCQISVRTNEDSVNAILWGEIVRESC